MTAILIAAIVSAGTFSLATVLARSSATFSSTWRVVQSRDGALHLLRDGIRHRLLPAPITDADLAVIPEREQLSNGVLPPLDLRSRGLLPGTVVTLRGHHHLWVADEQGTLHWVSDSRALAGRLVNWGRRLEATPEDLATAPRGEAWLSAPIVRLEGRVYLPTWNETARSLDLLQIESPVDVALLNLGDLSSPHQELSSLDQVTWEELTGVSVAALRRGRFEPILAGPVLLADPNPLLAASDVGTTTIIWRTGHPSVTGRVYVSVDGEEETLFAEGPSGTGSADWIVSGRTYYFSLDLGGGTIGATMVVRHGAHH